MKKIINKLKNWWDPFGDRVEIEVDDWEFKPSIDITAYELYQCQKKPIIGFGTLDEYKIKLSGWYTGLTINCRRHLFSYKQKCYYYKKYE